MKYKNKLLMQLSVLSYMISVPIIGGVNYEFFNGPELVKLIYHIVGCMGILTIIVWLIRDGTYLIDWLEDK